MRVHRVYRVGDRARSPRGTTRTRACSPGVGSAPPAAGRPRGIVVVTVTLFDGRPLPEVRVCGIGPLMLSC